LAADPGVLSKFARPVTAVPTAILVVQAGGVGSPRCRGTPGS
jgi:hypothetical protein